MMADLYESSRKRFKNDYKKTSKQLYSVMPETLTIQDKGHRTFGSGVFPMNIRGDNKQLCFGDWLCNRNKLEDENSDGFC